MEKVKALEVLNYSKKYRGKGNYAVKDASFVVNKGEFHGFIGANGAGKTTTIKSIIGAYAKFQGEIKIFGLSNKTRESKTKIGYIPEKADFPKGMSLNSYLFSMANLSGLSRKDSKIFASNKIEEFGLANVKKESPNSFSSGQKKKVLLAQALVSDPDLIIMDEPAANLDPKSRREFFQDLKKIQKSGKTIFISSHILAELDQFVDHITILDNGKMVYNGSVSKLSRGKKIKYEFILNDNNDLPKFKKLARLENMSIPNNPDNKLFVTFKSMEQLHAFIKKMINSNIIINEYKPIKLNLQDIYYNFVKIGSVDTPESLKRRDESD